MAWTSLCRAVPYSACCCRPGYNTVVVRIGSALSSLEGGATPGLTQCFVGVFAFQQILDIRNGRHMHHIGAFATIGCKCKSKSNILTNMALRNGALRKIEESGFGVQAICAKAPSLGLALVGRYELTVEGCLGKVDVPRGLDNYNTGPFRKLLDRLKSFCRPTLSIIARCTGFNTFILSVMPYTISYFGLTIVLTSTGYDRLLRSSSSDGTGWRLRSFRMFYGTLALRPSLTLLFQQLWRPRVSIYEKATRLKN